jgi:hypothetical protein
MFLNSTIITLSVMNADIALNNIPCNKKNEVPLVDESYFRFCLDFFFFFAGQSFSTNLWQACM